MSIIQKGKFWHLTLALLAILSLPSQATAQRLQGKVVDKNNTSQPLIGANVVWLGTDKGTATDASGSFSLALADAVSPTIVVTYIGYTPDTIAVQGKSTVTVALGSASGLKEVVVEGQVERHSALTSTQTEIITVRDLEKSACCNLAESFETNASVEVSTTDAVSGAKQIQMLGLDGAYTLLTTDNVPALRGLATPYRLNYLSGTFIGSIDIIKGMGSVLNGYESISGQVNVSLRDPAKTERLYLNLYGNHLGRYDANLNLSTNLGSKWSTLLMLHTDQLHHRVDRNNDGFMDLAVGSQYNVYNKWKYEHGDWVSEFGINALTEEKIGGQLKYSENQSIAAQPYYGTESDVDRLSGFNKTSYTFPGKPYQSIGLITSATHHAFTSQYGWRAYNGEQNSANARLIFQSIIGDTRHTYKTGLSYTLEDYSESLSDSAFSRTERIPGAFAEYIYNNAADLTVVAGARVDYHNLYGTVFTPRLNIKYDFSPTSIARIAAGRGFRVANPIAENTAALVSSRRIRVEEALDPEEAWSVGGSFTHYFKLANRPGSFVTDFYHTSFTNQVVTDMYSSPGQVLFYNLKGRSFSNSFQAEVQYEILRGFDAKAAYKYYDVRTSYKGDLLQKPMIPEHRFFVNLGFATPFDKWRADLTTQFFGLMPLATLEHQPAPTEMQERTSDRFMTVNSQVTRAFKRWDVYLGVENLLNYRQPNPIIGADEPFGNNFDASMVWGPITGRTVYAGLRYRID
ncbi:TonB-dependent receptor [Pontibacter akesuensis]|uniref:Outer membrane cobalamin receptor protein n=1 Tax=Pontibacter akesuensis TaxID=388950 RepID=A0A1I7GXU6_9BACT|nr:TonB-dependent receptor [Pontibacter akesuensis]GHA54519.1 TonB-dependent receptor [Pontibacter akesuensis]SFU53288.1 Outer membrane cobalamin receptor protein [Pontibacter akesuensis]